MNYIFYVYIYIFLITLYCLYYHKITIAFKILTFIAKIKVHCKNKNKKITNDNLIDLFKYNNNKITYYIRPNNLENIISNCQFLVIEYKDDKSTIDIDLTNEHFFMINGSTILDYDFIKWYLKKFNNYDIKNNYKINIIDENTDVLELKYGNSITLCKNNYTINTMEYAS